MKVFFLLATILLFLACNNEPPQVPADPATADASADSDSSNKNYFPVYDFLKSEIAAVNNASSGIKKYSSSLDRTDSTYIQLQEFNTLAQEFLPASLQDLVFQQEFKETSFIDKSTGGSTFFYTTTNPSIDLRRADVLTQKTESYDKVKSIYLERNYRSANNDITKKLYWKPGRNFQIITHTSVNSGDPVTELVKIVWDNRE